VLHEQAADERTGNRRDGEGRGDAPLPAWPLARVDEVADRRHRKGHESAGRYALDGSRGDQLSECLRDAACG